MKRISKRSRQWLLGLVLILTALCIWWVYDYEPRRSQLAFTEDALRQERERHEMLTSRLQRFSADDKKQQSQNQQLEALSARIVPGKSIEEVNAQAQIELQKFLDDHEISLTSYRAMAPGKWRDYKLAKMRFSLNITTREFSRVLEYLEKLDKAVRVTGMNIRYRKRKTGLLRITLELSSLFME
ncbi:MAG: GspMb/PilO family protein [Pseudomonadota bacterium]|nr:GspMb/PilO family protein [Pseudomonadota bacterium]